MIGGPTKRMTTWHQDGYTLAADRSARVKAGEFRPQGSHRKVDA